MFLLYYKKGRGCIPAAVDGKECEYLERMAKAQEQMAAVMGKPEGIFKWVTDPLGVIITILGIIGIVDIIRNWILGG